MFVYGYRLLLRLLRRLERCVLWCFVFFFKQKTAYELRISDWSSDVCSSDLPTPVRTTLRQCNRNRLPPTRSPFPRLRGKGTGWGKPAQCAGFLFPGLATFQTGTMAPLWERLQPRALRVAPPPPNGCKGVPRFGVIQKAERQRDM